MHKLLEVLDINKRYGNTEILNDISFNINEGEFLVIMGSSGAGKTTLLNCISGMDSISSGDVKFQGNSIKRCNDKQLEKFRSDEIGFVFQDFQLIDDMTLLDNLLIRGYLIQKKDVAIKKACDLLHRLNLWSVRNNYSNELSGGQKQRGAIARALMNNPKVIFADEPTGSLNSKEGKNVLNILYSINKQYNTTIVMVTHDVKAAIYGSKIIYMSDGKIVDNFEFIDTPISKSRIQKLNQFLDRMGW